MRVQLEVPEAIANRVKSLMKEAGVKNYSDFFGYALTGLDWMAKERRLGRMIVSTDAEFTQVRELSMPFLDAIYHGAEDQKQPQPAAPAPQPAAAPVSEAVKRSSPLRSRRD
jgi:hypothetical protein